MFVLYAISLGVELEVEMVGGSRWPCLFCEVYSWVN